MIADFLDAPDRVRHDEFQAWRREHPDAYFLSFQRKNAAKLHQDGKCHHPGDTEWSSLGGGHSLTRSRKVCGETFEELTRWAADHDVQWTWCAQCDAAREESGADHRPLPAPKGARTLPEIEGEVEDISSDEDFVEGHRRTFVLDRHERNPRAREACIKAHGARCCVCRLSFGDVYGELGEGFIEVHHLDPLADAMTERPVDPVRDLVPVCPNCHRMLHRETPPLTPAELAGRLCRR